MLEVGHVIQSKFLVQEVIHGGMSIVYICSPLTTHDEKSESSEISTSVDKKRWIAIKTIPPETWYSDDNADLFARECLISTTLPPHPYLLRMSGALNGVSPTDRNAFFMPYAQNGSLRNKIRTEGSGLAETVPLFRKISVGLKFLASQGIIHRDVKPENILFADDDRNPRITDFGLSSKLQVAHNIISESPQLDVDTSSVLLGGTLPYMSPEHFGESDISTSSDIYSFGAMLFEFVTGHAPFICSNVEEYRISHSTRPVPLPPPHASKDIIRVALKCLEKKPKDRYRDFSEIDRKLAQIAGENNIPCSDLEDPSVEELEESMSPMDWAGRGMAWNQLGRRREALHCYRRSYEIEPNQSANCCNFGKLLVTTGQVDEGLKLLEKAAELSPSMIIIHSFLGDAYRLAGRSEDAITQWARGASVADQEKDEGVYALYRRLAEAHKSRGENEKCTYWTTKALARLQDGPDSEKQLLWVNEGIHYGLLELFEISETILTEVTIRFPNLIDGWHNLAATFAHRGKWSHAQTALARSIEINPTGPQTLFFQGFVALCTAGEYGSIDAWTTLLRLHPAHLFARLAASTMSNLSTTDMRDVINICFNQSGRLYYRV